MSIKKDLYGKTKDGNPIDIFTLKNSKGVEVQIINLGGIVVSIKVPDRFGNFADVVLGYDKLEDYFHNINNFGAIIGRYANRIENATIEFNGVEYNLSKNNGKHLIHGGFVGFDKVVWKADIIKQDKEESLQLTYTSSDGEEGFPGELKVKVIYTLTADNALKIEYFADSDKDTVVNLTNHSYFNLLGRGDLDILSHELMINADNFTIINDECIPTGEICSVVDTPFDFTTMKTIGDGLLAENQQIKYGDGYDHNFVLKVNGKTPQKIAELYEEKTGRLMETYTTMPGVQLYTANNLIANRPGKGGQVYKKRDAVCLETQFFPNSLKYKNFPSPILRACEEYEHTTIYKFSTR
ncbi:aldose epimerase family protein [Clostridium sp.]|uniref:aldose epimerase family protein n=1 Tax=Clostridium sp. TaxID=1506 RepID=UPI003D6CB8CE